MLDRQDIDALLMGALYGELSPAESSRLDEHLSAHPQDKLVLDGLGRARQALRDSHVLALQAEPPAAVSAVLLQEAARRAPEPREARVGLFAKLAVFLRHPATAAAAVIVLVAGVASTLYMRGVDEKSGNQEVVATPAAAPPRLTVADQPNAGSGSATFHGADDGELAAGKDDAQKQLHEADRVGGDGDDYGYRADLATDDLGGAKEEKAKPKLSRNGADKDQGLSSDSSGTKGNAAPTRDKRRYIEVTTPDPQPKSPDEGKTAMVRGSATATVIVPLDPSANADGQAMNGDALSRPESGTKTKPSSTAPAGGAPGSVADTAPGAYQSGLAKAPAPPPVRDDTAAKTAHARVVTLVKANKCKDAAKMAMTIYDAYPDYYAEFVANDRQVKVCRPYIETERKKRNEAMKSRAKNANESVVSPDNVK